MKTTLILFLMTLTVAGFAQTQRPDPRSRVIANLNQIESMYLSRLSGKELQDAVRLLNETRAIIAGLPVEQPSSGSGYGNQISDEGLQALVKAVRNEGFDDDRTDIILGSVGKRGRISIGQLRSLIPLISDDTYKRKLLIALYDNVIDPVNISLVLQFFTYPGDRDAVLKVYQNQ